MPIVKKVKQATLKENGICISLNIGIVYKFKIGRL